MKINAVIEIPKGDNRRRHLNYAQTAIEDFGAIVDVIPINDGVMPIAYGYLEGTLNKVEKDNVDVIVFSSNTFQVGEKVLVEPFAILRRSDDDHKILATDETMKITAWEDVKKEERDLLLEYFGYKHPITAIEDKRSAEEYIRTSTL